MRRQKLEELDKTFEFKWTVSRGRDTYGYKICSLWINGSKATSCNGGGYDMQSTCLAEWMICALTKSLQKLKPSRLSGLSFWNFKRRKVQQSYSKDCKISLDGAVGFASVINILKKCGYKLTFVVEAGRVVVYTLAKYTQSAA